MNWKKAGPIILSIIGSIGTIGTAVLTAIGTKKALEKVDKLKETKEPTKLEVVKAVIPSYAPAAIIGIITIAANTSGTIMSQKTQASLSATCYALSKGYNKYKDKIKETLGFDKHKDILTQIAKEDKVPENFSKNNDEKELYWEEHLGYFLADPKKFAYAASYINERFHGIDSKYYYTLKDLVDDSELELLDETKLNGLENIGWQGDYLYEVYGNCWVYTNNFINDSYDDDLKAIRIIFYTDPIFNPSEWDYDYVEYYKNNRGELLYPDNLTAEKVEKELEELNEKESDKFSRKIY